MGAQRRHRDVGEKVDLYGRLGAEEYYIFDPIAMLQPPFQAYHRAGRRLVPQAVGSEQRIASPVTGLIFGIVDDWLRVIDPAIGAVLLTPDEERAARIAAEQRWEAAQRAQEAAQRARLAAEERAREGAQARLAAEERARREEQGRWAPEQEQGSAEERFQRAKQGRLAAEACIAALEAQLRSIQGRGDQGGAGGAGT